MSQAQFPSLSDSIQDNTQSPIDEAPPLTYLKGTTFQNQVRYTPSQQGPISREALLFRQKLLRTQPLPAGEPQLAAQQLPAGYYSNFDGGPPPQVRGQNLAGLQPLQMCQMQPMQYSNYQRDLARSAEARQRDAQMQAKLDSASSTTDVPPLLSYTARVVGDGLYPEGDSAETLTERSERGDIPGSDHWTIPLYPNQWPVVPGSNPSNAVHGGVVTDADQPSVKSEDSNKASEPSFLADRFFPMIPS